ncbi:hypothetical protein FHQ18_01825 [Deferribacter autotrophicus]|uniref:Lipoprotein n=1 Tax=Deferribacter autotrophicus TaxID=500465 RepID=A0A5A8F639_9BACT|nr:hypothetical protein [Deferribacter autotrophicus]KAA0259215.1 hypothetical protein FHQ18_01825 [Deferribacter autotrophicus]
MKRILFLFLIFLISCVSKTDPYKLKYIWQPESDYGRELKSIYVAELLSVYENIKLTGLKVQEKGIGFTTSLECEGKDICDDNKFYMFIILQNGELNSLRYKDYEKRKSKMFKKYGKDIKYLLKTSKLDNLLKNKDFGGFIIDLNWTFRDLKHITKPVFESYKYEIKKDEIM